MSVSARRNALFRNRDCVALFEQGGCRVSIVRCTNALDRALRKWEWGSELSEREQRVAQEVVGSMVAGTVLCNSLLKEDERTQGVLATGGNGEHKIIMAEATRTGALRARLPRRVAGELYESIWGQQPQTLFLDSVRITYGSSTPYVSSVALAPGEKTSGVLNRIDDLWNHSLALSDQLPTSLVTMTRVDPSQGKVKLCAGMLVQGLAGNSKAHDVNPEEALRALHSQFCKGEATPNLLALMDDPDIPQFVNSTLGLSGDQAFQIRERDQLSTNKEMDAYMVDAFCPCSAERFAVKILSSVHDLREQEGLFDEASGAINVRCEFCNASHSISRPFLDSTRANLASQISRAVLR